jgi:hypothetical protein
MCHQVIQYKWVTSPSSQNVYWNHALIKTSSQHRHLSLARQRGLGNISRISEIATHQNKQQMPTHQAGKTIVIGSPEGWYLI